MNGKFLIDTNIVIAIFANDATVINSLANANEVFVPSIALGELYYGAHKSRYVETNITRIEYKWFPFSDIVSIHVSYFYKVAICC